MTGNHSRNGRTGAASLVELAKTSNPPKRSTLSITDQDVELAMAWAKDEVTLTQVQRVKRSGERMNSNIYIYLARCLKEAIRREQHK